MADSKQTHTALFFTKYYKYIIYVRGMDKMAEPREGQEHNAFIRRQVGENIEILDNYPSYSTYRPQFLTYFCGFLDEFKTVITHIVPVNKNVWAINIIPSKTTKIIYGGKIIVYVDKTYKIIDVPQSELIKYSV